MQPIVQVILVAGIVLVVSLLLAAIAWGIRIRRDEDNFIPPPGPLKKSDREFPDPFAEKEAAQDGLRELKRGVADTIPAAEKGQVGTGPESPMKNILRSAVPELSTLMDLGKIVSQAGDSGGSSEERRRALLNAVEQMLEKQPDKALLRELRDTLRAGEESPVEDSDESTVQVIRVGGRNVIRIDGTDYYSLADIPNPDLRDEAMRMLLDLDDQKPL
jgi:hypothetical protein